MSAKDRIHLALVDVASDIKTVLTFASSALIFVGTVTIPLTYQEQFPTLSEICFISGLIGFAIRAGLQAITA
jgi:hypothetical protein